MKWFKGKQKLEPDNMTQLRQLTTDIEDEISMISNVYASIFASEDVSYVSDLNNFKILWANKHTQELFGPHVIGVECYKVLQGMDFPCSFCTSPHMQPGQTKTWVHYNPIVERTFLVKDRIVTWSGRPARFELAVDITDVEGLK